MVKINKTNNEGETMKTDYYKMTTTERKEITRHILNSEYDNNADYLKVGDKVWYCGYHSSSYRLFEIEEVSDNRDMLKKLGRLTHLKQYMVTYTLRNIKSNGDVGKTTATSYAFNLHREVA